MKSYENVRLIKGEDLNHHDTLFAGRMAEWFIESAVIAAASTYGKLNIVCFKIHDIKFIAPVQKGEMVTFIHKMIKVGTSSMVVYGKALNSNKNRVLEGFITFVSVDENGRKVAHNISLENPETDEELELIRQIDLLK